MSDAPTVPMLLAAEQNGARLTVLGFDVQPEPRSAQSAPSDGLLSGVIVRLPDLGRYIGRCLALGIGRSGEDAITALAGAEWFAHLPKSAPGPRQLLVTAASGDRWLENLIHDVGTYQVASIALGSAPSASEIALACETGRLLRRGRTFVVCTTAVLDPETLQTLGQACDCIVGGDGSEGHHQYPARAVSWPAQGRLICYDLYDVLSMWAGRIGRHGAEWTAPDAMHVEVSTDIETLAAIDRIATSYLTEARDPGGRLVSVVDGLQGKHAVATAFRRSGFVRQCRVPMADRQVQSSGE